MNYKHHHLACKQFNPLTDTHFSNSFLTTDQKIKLCPDFFYKSFELINLDKGIKQHRIRIKQKLTRNNLS